jgi:hypothetical protein
MILYISLNNNNNIKYVNSRNFGVILEQTQRKTLNSREEPCDETNSQLMTNCLEQFITNKLDGCHAPWFVFKTSGKLNKNIKNYIPIKI